MWHTQAIDHKSKDSLIKLDVHSPGRITVTHSPVKRQHLGPIQATCHMEHCSILIQIMWLSYKAENLEKIASQCHHLRPFPWSRWTQSLMCWIISTATTTLMIITTTIITTTTTMPTWTWTLAGGEEMLFPQNRRNALAVENQASLSKTSANASEWLLRENTWLGSRYKLSSSLLLHSQVKVNFLEKSERGAFMSGGIFMSLTVPGLLALSNSALVSLAEQRKCFRSY